MKDENEVIFEVLAGTYEEYLLGFKFTGDDNEYKLTQTVAQHSHKSSVRCVAAYSDRLASGGTDETIHIYDLKSRRECGMLIHHHGTVTCLSFTPDGSHLISGGEDGSLAVVRSSNWALEKIWTKSHKGEAVLAVSIHPSGKMMLSIGADKTLRTWNLVKGRPAYTINLVGHYQTRPDIVQWSLCGEYYCIAENNTVNIYSTAKAGIEKSFQIKNRITCVQFIENVHIVLGDWSGDMTCMNALNGNITWTIPRQNEVRIKVLSLFCGYLISATSEGTIKVHKLNDTPEEVAKAETSCRITCLTASKTLKKEKPEKKKKRKRVAGESPSRKVICCPSNFNWTVS